MSNEGVIADYPDLSEESIRVVIGYASVYTSQRDCSWCST